MPDRDPTDVVHGPWTDYRFAEPSIPERAQIRTTAKPDVAADLVAPAVLDPGLELLQRTFEQRLARTPIVPVDHAPGRATHWIAFSPFELFLEHVVARKLGSVE